MNIKKSIITSCFLLLIIFNNCSCSKKEKVEINNNNFPEVEVFFSKFPSKYTTIYYEVVLYFGKDAMVRGQWLKYFENFETIAFRCWVRELLQLIALKPTRLQEIKTQYKKFIKQRNVIKKVKFNNFEHSQILGTHKEKFFCIGGEMSYSGDDFVEHLKEADEYFDKILTKNDYIGILEIALMSNTKVLRIKALKYLFLIGFTEADLIKIWERIPDSTNVKEVNLRIKEIADFEYVHNKFFNKKMDF